MSHGRLVSVAVERFKSYRAHTRLDLKPLTVLVGRNNSGKSTMMQALLLLKQTLETPRADVSLSLVGAVEALNLREGLVTFLPGAITEVMNHGATNVQAHPEYTYTVNPVRWSPTFGEDILVLIARSRLGSWVSALYVLPDGRYRHGSTFVLREDPQPLALAYGPARREVAWATCWGCGGESGLVAYDETNRVVIVQR